MIYMRFYPVLLSIKNFDFNLIDDQLSDSLPAIAKSLIRKTSYLENKVFNDYKI